MEPVKESLRGIYVGQCRLNYNILEQWNGKKWNEVPNVFHEERRGGKIHFDVEDALDD